MDLQNKKIMKPIRNLKPAQFTIKIIRENNETRHFSIFSSDTSEEAAKKLAANLKLDDFHIPYWAAYIEERRLDLGIKSYGPNSPGRGYNNYGNLIIRHSNLFIILGYWILTRWFSATII